MVLFCFVLVLVFDFFLLLFLFLVGKSPAWVPFTIFRTNDHLTIPLGTGKGMEEKKLVEMDCWFKVFFS